MKFIKSLLVLLISAILLISVAFLVSNIKGSNAILKVTSGDTKSKVYLNKQYLGETPLLKYGLKEGDYELRLEAVSPDNQQNKLSFVTQVSLNQANLTAVNYDFGPDKVFSSGDIRTSKPGGGVAIISSPGEAEVFIDGENKGKTPLSLFLNSGIHKLKLSKKGYFSREIEVNIETNLRIVIDVLLAKNPFSTLEKIRNDKLIVYDISTEHTDLTNQPFIWAQGIFYFGKAKNLEFDTAIDQTGQIFTKNQTDLQKKIKDGQPIMIALLRNSKEAISDSSKAKLASLESAWFSASPTSANIQKVQIINTPTGTLNVRSGPGTSYKIVTKVQPGEQYEMLLEQDGWFKIKVGEIEGWISTQYAKKL